MCLAVPTKLIEVHGSKGKVELSGTVREVGLQLIDEPAVGDYVLVHAGFAIQKVNQEEAEETLRMLQQMYEGAGEQ